MPIRLPHLRCLLLVLLAIALRPGCPGCQAQESNPLPSSKKGFCTLVGNDGAWKKKVQSLNAKWFYSWGSQIPPDVPEGVEFVPMIWGRVDWKKNDVIPRLSAAGRRGEVKCLLGFNEPDQHEQSNLTVREAVGMWPHLMKTGLPLASPGCVHPDREWMHEFMERVDDLDLRVDYVCVHSYGGPNAQALVQRLRQVHKKFNRPIWITEFAVGDWNAKTAADNKHSPAKIASFMRQVLPMLEELDFVYRYAWFSASPASSALGTSALFESDGSLTELGEIYSSY